MSAVQPTLPTFNPSTKRVYRIDDTLPAIVTEITYADHLDACKNAFSVIAKTQAELEAIERKVEFLDRRLDDPELEDDPRRDAAYDRLKAYCRQIDEHTAVIKNAICEVDSHGRHLAAADLEWLGNHTGWNVIERVHATEPETTRMDVWKSIAENTAPF